jgi:hypothetical protein
MPLAGSKAIPNGAEPTGMGLPIRVFVWPDITETYSLSTELHVAKTDHLNSILRVLIH